MSWRRTRVAVGNGISGCFVLGSWGILKFIPEAMTFLMTNNIANLNVTDDFIGID